MSGFEPATQCSVVQHYCTRRLKAWTSCTYRLWRGYTDLPAMVWLWLTGYGVVMGTYRLWGLTSYGVVIRTYRLWCGYTDLPAMVWLYGLTGYGVVIQTYRLWCGYTDLPAMVWLYRLTGYGVVMTYRLWRGYTDLPAMAWLWGLTGYGVVMGTYRLWGLTSYGVVMRSALESWKYCIVDFLLHLIHDFVTVLCNLPYTC